MGPSRPTIGSVVRRWRLAQGMSLEQLAERAACAKSYLSEIENGRRPGPPRAEVLARIEAALDLREGTLQELAAWERTPGEVRERMAELESRDRLARRLVELVAGPGGSDGGGARVGRSLDAAYKSGELRRLIDSIKSSGGVEEVSVGRVLPLEIPLINSVAAGYPAEFTDLGYPARVADEYVRAPDVADPDAFAARVVGDSMLPDYREGDIVIFSPARAARSGMDCFVRLERDHESTFKRVFFEPAGGAPEEAEWIRLQPLNSAYPVRVVHREEVAGLYAAVSVTRAIA